MIKNKQAYRRFYNFVHTYAMGKHQRRAYLSVAKAYKKNVTINESLFSDEIIRDYKNKWRGLDRNPDPIFFMLYSSMRGEVDFNYVPDYLYRYPIEPILNNSRFSNYCEHKCLYEKRLPEHRDLFPCTVLRRIDGVFYDKNYILVSNPASFLRNCSEPYLVAKEALDTGAGQGVRLFTKDDRNDEFLDEVGATLLGWVGDNPNVVIQKKEQQSKIMEGVNSSSINTFRVVTYRSVKTNETTVLQSLIKRGPSGSFVDNLNSGGNFIEIESNGQVANYGLTKTGEKIPFDNPGIDSSMINSIRRLAVSVAKTHLLHRQLFFDIFMDNRNQVRIMEINLTAHPTIQAVCGPAFGEYTDEMIQHCHNHTGHIVRVIPYNIARN